MQITRSLLTVMATFFSIWQATPALTKEIELSNGAVFAQAVLPGSNSTVAPTKQQIYRVPILKRISGVPTVSVSFNGNYLTAYSMLVDTAASITVITPAIAEAVGWQQTGTVEASLSSGDRITVPIGKVQSIHIGGTQINDLTVAVGPVPLLGQNLLGQFTILISPNLILLRPNTASQAQTVSPPNSEAITPQKLQK